MGPEFKQRFREWAKFSLWNFPIAALISLFFIRRWSISSVLLTCLVSSVITQITMTFCYWGAFLLFAFVGRSRRPRGRWTFLVALALMPFGVTLGFGGARAVGGLFRLHIVSPGIMGSLPSLLVGALITALFFLYGTYKDAQAQQLRAQLSALTAQINPHFLFNSLNTIASLVHSNPHAAEEMTLSLARLFRSILACSERERHSLMAELDICRSYLAIERMRFGERLRGPIEVDASVDPTRLQVPVLILQPLIENAVKYAVAPRVEGGEVRIQVNRKNEIVELIVTDDGPGMGKSSAEPGNGTALRNLKDRIAGCSGRLELSDRAQGGAQASILLPYQEV